MPISEESFLRMMLLSAIRNETCAAAIDNETFWQLVAFKAELEPIAA